MRFRLFFRVMIKSEPAVSDLFNYCFFRLCPMKPEPRNCKMKESNFTHSKIDICDIIPDFLKRNKVLIKHYADKPLRSVGHSYMLNSAKLPKPRPQSQRCEAASHVGLITVETFSLRWNFTLNM